MNLSSSASSIGEIIETAVNAGYPTRLVLTPFTKNQDGKKMASPSNPDASGLALSWSITGLMCVGEGKAYAEALYELMRRLGVEEFDVKISYDPEDAKGKVIGRLNLAALPVNFL